jgi:hypothetical protein
VLTRTLTRKWITAAYRQPGTGSTEMKDNPSLDSGFNSAWDVHLSSRTAWGGIREGMCSTGFCEVQGVVTSRIEGK